MKTFSIVASLLTLAGTKFAVAASMRIVAYGDSGVYGKGVARNETYPAQLEAMLRQKGYDVTVTNDGVNGLTSTNAVAYVGSVGKADVVIVHDSSKCRMGNRQTEGERRASVSGQQSIGRRLRRCVIERCAVREVGRPSTRYTVCRAG